MLRSQIFSNDSQYTRVPSSRYTLTRTIELLGDSPPSNNQYATIHRQSRTSNERRESSSTEIHFSSPRTIVQLRSPSFTFTRYFQASPLFPCSMSNIRFELFASRRIHREVLERVLAVLQASHGRQFLRSPLAFSNRGERLGTRQLGRANLAFERRTFFKYSTSIRTYDVDRFRFEVNEKDNRP